VTDIPDGDGDPDEPARELERELLGGDRRYTRVEVAERAGVSVEQARALWRALGFADVGDDNIAFTDRDVEALVAVQDLISRGLIDETTQLAMTRSMGQSLARLAEWQVAALTDAMARDQSLAEGEALVAAEDLVPLLEGLIGFVWRRHLAAAANRALARADASTDAPQMAVGFADLVGFTSLTRQAEEDDLADLVERFEAIATDVIAEQGGRVIKTVGDEVMFAADDAATAAEIALQLLERVDEDAELPDLRVGVACGTVLPRLGDVFGEPVNIASRLTSFARPGSALVDREMAAALDGDERYRLRRVPPRPVRGYALLQGMRLRRSDPQPADPQPADSGRAGV
jgi:adenylate cyclase